MKRLLVLSLLILATGCSMEASIGDIAGISVTFEDPAKTTGLVSGSTQVGSVIEGGVTTYHVQSTVGNYMSGIEQTTTDNSYKVYSSVQGAIVSQ